MENVSPIHRDICSNAAINSPSKTGRLLVALLGMALKSADILRQKAMKAALSLLRSVLHL